MLTALLSSLNHSRSVRRLLTWKEAMEEKGLRVNAKKDKDHDLWYRPRPAEFRRVFMC